jgi:hypothetical protein
VIEHIYIQHAAEDWPGPGDTEHPTRPVIRVYNAELRDGRGKGDHGEDVGQHFVITLEYGCTHTKLGLAAPWGKWWCAQKDCNHFIGRKGQRGK